MQELRLKKEEPCRSLVSKRGTMQELGVQIETHQRWRTATDLEISRTAEGLDERFPRKDGEITKTTDYRNFQDGGPMGLSLRRWTYVIKKYPKCRTSKIERFPRWRTYGIELKMVDLCD
jgi:hypothetical protein